MLLVHLAAEHGAHRAEANHPGHGQHCAHDTHADSQAGATPVHAGIGQTHDAHDDSDNAFQNGQVFSVEHNIYFHRLVFEVCPQKLRGTIAEKRFATDESNFRLLGNRELAVQNEDAVGRVR